MKFKIHIFLYPLLTLSYLLLAQPGFYQFDLKTLKAGTPVSDNRFTNSEAIEFIPKTEKDALVLAGTANNVPWCESGYLVSETKNCPLMKFKKPGAFTFFIQFVASLAPKI